MKDLIARFELRLGAVRLPSRPVCAALVLLCLGFGALIGRVTRTSANAGRQRIELKQPSAVAQQGKLPPTSKPASTPSSEEESGGAESKSSSNHGGSGKGAAGSKAAARSQGASIKQQEQQKPSTKLPAIKHVFLIMLGEVPYAESFGPESKSRYLSHTLEAKGELLERYYAVAHQQLPDGIALISGQGPTEQTASDCPTYTEIAPAGNAADEQVTGSGCVYPSAVKTIASQLRSKHLTWKAYIQAIGDGGSESSSACYHPRLGAADPTAALGLPTATASAGGIGSATFSDPFVYFRSVTDSSACAEDVVGMQGLAGDLHSASRTPSFSYIAPDLCDDGTSRPCAPGKQDGMAAAEGFLEQVAPEILASKAYKQSGLLIITVAQAPSSGEYADSSSCCDQPQYPNIHASSATAGKGGGEVGALLLSPFIKGAQISQQTYNDFSMLRTIEDVFGLQPLGYAALSGVQALSPSLFSGG
jgi:phosphatidylinositol-3-phosphatase